MTTYASERLQDEMKKTLGEIDKDYLRKMQGDMYKCAARCCEDKVLSHERFQKCVENCGMKIHAAQEFIRSEVNNFQDRLNRCYMTCNDKITDKMPTSPSQSEIEKYREELDKCANKCAETHLELISHLFKRTTEYLSKSEFQRNAA